MIKSDITILNNDDYLNDIDVHFAKFITDLHGGYDPDIFLAAALVSRATGNGDGYLDLNSAAEKPIPFRFNGKNELKSPKLSKWLIKLNQTPVVGMPGEFRPLIIDKKNRLYLYRYWDYEKKLSTAILYRIKKDVDGIDIPLLRNSLERLFPEKHGDTFDWQKVAAVIAAFKKICVITGSPGTGKTYTMAKILAVLLELYPKDKPNILLAAPTGKAAARIGESIKSAKKTINCSNDIRDAVPSEAFTIHRMLKTIPGSPYFYHNAENPLSADIVVVDEVSMADLALMSKLFSAIKNDARIILIGDRDQLASVETGFVMADICDRDNTHTFSEHFNKQFKNVTGRGIDITREKLIDKPGLCDCMVVLKKSYRFADTSGIGGCSRAVNNGKIDEAFYILKNNPDQIDWKNISAPKEISSFLSKKVIKGYSEYLKTRDPMRALERFNRFRILCAVKFGPLGVNEINRLTEQILSQSGLIEIDNLASYPWYKGRPVLITRNDYNLELFNGDVGIAMPDQDSKRKDLYVYFLGGSGELRRFLPHRLPEHETAFAMTVHKSQGSEFDTVLLILPNRDYPVLTRELLYTGITRAKKNISIWGTKEIIRNTISRKIERTSGLKDDLWG